MQRRRAAQGGPGDGGEGPSTVTQRHTCDDGVSVRSLVEILHPSYGGRLGERGPGTRDPLCYPRLFLWPAIISN